MGLKYKRILLKLSGETLGGQSGSGYDPETMGAISGEIKQAVDLGAEVAIVVGGGNIFRGVFAKTLNIDRVPADHMGMLATVMNAIALQNSLEKAGLSARVLSALEVRSVTEPFVIRRALHHLEKKRVVILAGGTGDPFFTTDTPAALRGIELRADAVLKATKVDGVYSKDPKKFPDAVRFDEITYKDAIDRQLNVMDLTAFTLCMENDLPIVVFNIRETGNIIRVIQGEKVGSLVHA